MMFSQEDGDEEEQEAEALRGLVKLTAAAGDGLR